MLKEIKSEKDAITNVDLFNEIVAKVKESADTLRLYPKLFTDFA